MKQFNLRPSRSQVGTGNDVPRPPAKSSTVGFRRSFRSSRIEKNLKVDVDGIMKSAKMTCNANGSKIETKKMKINNISQIAGSSPVVDRFSWNLASPIADQRRIMRDNKLSVLYKHKPISPKRFSPAHTRNIKFDFGSPTKSNITEQSVVQAKQVTTMESSVMVILGSLTIGNSQESLILHGPKSPTKLDPKVFVPFKKIHGTSMHAPRAVVVERKKQMYRADDLETLLRNAGVPEDAFAHSEFDIHKQLDSKVDLKVKPEALPLELFDNSMYEIRSPQKWIQNGFINQYDKGTSIPARALHFPESGKWEDCFVTGYDDETARFKVDWEKQTGENHFDFLSRLRVCFNSEDPHNFVKRILFACNQRQLAQALIRYNLYIDCMPTDGVSQLDLEQANRILNRALNSKSLKKKEFDTNNLLTEVSTDYARTMNKIIFDSNLKTGDNEQLIDSLQSLVAAASVNEQTRKPVPLCGVVDRPKYDFAQQFSTYAFHTFLAQKEVVLTLVHVNQERNEVLSLTGLLKGTKRPLKMEEFKSTQDHLRRTLYRRLEEWGNRTADVIKSGLQTAGKGHYNLEESERGVYKYTKLNGLLRRINFLMEDTLHDITENTINQYTEFIKNVCSGNCRVISPLEVIYTARIRTGVSSTKHPMFLVEIVQSKMPVCLNQSQIYEQQRAIENWTPPTNDPDAICDIEVIEPIMGYNLEYTVSAEAASNAILLCFDTFVRALMKLEQVEHKVLNNLLWSRTPLLKALAPNATSVHKARGYIETTLDKCTKPMKTYLQQFEKYIYFLNMDINDLEETFRPIVNEGRSTIKLKPLCTCVNTQLKAADELLYEIPSEPIRIMASVVSSLSIRTALRNKRLALAKLLQDNLADHIRINGKRILYAYEQIRKKINGMPRNIEELQAQSDFMDTVPGTVFDLKHDANGLYKDFGILESFQYKAPEIFKMRWNIYGWPQKVDGLVEVTKRILEQKKREYALQMGDEQVVFEQTLVALESEIMSFSTYQDIRRYTHVEEHRLQVCQKLDHAKSMAQTFNARETLFKQDLTDYSHLESICSHFEPFNILWKTAYFWITKHDSWLNGRFCEVDGLVVESSTDTANKDIRKAIKLLEKMDMPGCVAIGVEIERQVSEFLPHVPLIMGLRNPGMRKRHWDEISNKIGTELRPDEQDGFSLQMCFDMDLQKHCTLIARVGEQAGKEYQIESSLDKMAAEWTNIELQIMPYFKCDGAFILKGVDELMAILDEHITMTQATAFSPFKGPFEERIDQWGKKLLLMSEVIDEWMGLQRNWLYLQPIFDSDDIMKQLPTEAKRFRTVDKNWRKSMHTAKNKPDPVYICANDKLLKSFQESNKLLDLVQKGLAEYLETKRTVFTRFYFLSNDELLSILSQTKDVTLVQPHLKKCFEGISRVEFGVDCLIVKMISRENEQMGLKDPVNPNICEVEFWMQQLETMMRISVREQIKLSIEDYTQISRCSWMQKWQSMCVLNGSQFHWTKEMEDSLTKHGTNGLKKMLDLQIARLADMTVLVRGRLNKQAKTAIGALTVVDVHAREVTKKLIADNVSSKEEFLWLSQMRYYWEERDMVVEMVASRRPYGYEYLGNSFRLVITPLTDKCYLTLMGALQMILGGAPAGPAGTGKTETTKDLAKALAKQCVVFNCSDGLDYQQMGKFFKGLASCGAWACFDEFNRIEVEVLSVVAQQIITLQSNVRLGNTQIEFEGSKISLNAEFSVFITMNPGYAGRAELPDNLKACFRPVAMMVPDYALIAEIMLFAYGFEMAAECGAKMVATFRLCSEQLSAQYHYDYGMRAVKTTIVAAGNLKSKEPNANELQLLLRALQDVNLPKFLALDLPLFQGIISDLFPGIERPLIDYGALMQALKLSAEISGLQPVPFFLTKNIQLYETIVVRHGLMVVGPSGAGKSENLSTLTSALSLLKENEISGNLYETVKQLVINPKAITMGQLYGEFDPNTREFMDGVLPNLYRKAAEDTSTDRKWVIFDGPVDAIWIENMNTVLDDNKKLCLNSGEMLQMSETMSMIFEVNDLSVASPATVSRCGMVYMEPQSLGLQPLILSWFSTLPGDILSKTSCVEILSRCFEQYLKNAISLLRRFNKEPVPTVDGNLAQSLMRILDSFFYKFKSRDGELVYNEEDLRDMERNAECLFIFALIWSVGASTDLEGRFRFSAWLKAEMLSNGLDFPSDNGLVYDYVFNQREKKWAKWMDALGNIRISTNGITYNEIVVPTKDSVRSGYLLEYLLRSKKHVLLTGATGTGKTTSVMQYLSGSGHRFLGVNNRLMPLIITFSAQTTQNQTQDYLDSKMEKRKKGVYGPPVGKEFIIYVDDLNMPRREKYFAQPPLELLRQGITQGGWYDRKTLGFRKIIDRTFVGSMGPPGGGRNPITERLKRHFNLINLVDYDDASKTLIFSSILSQFVLDGGFNQGIIEVQQSMVSSTINVYNRISAELLPTPSRPHYTFNLRDLSKVFQGLLMCDSMHIESPEVFSRLWVHECRRVFQDRLINTVDSTWFNDVLKEEIKENFGMAWSDVVPRSRLFFGSYVAHDCAYEEIPDETRLQAAIEEYLENYNEEHSKAQMYLVMFLDAIDHVSRISRILRQHGGNALCLGVGGSGRQSLTRLATFISEYSCFQVEIKKGYNLGDWRDDIKTCLLRSGVQQQKITFLFSDTQIVIEQQLEDINNILNSGDIPNLYSADEIENIMSSCRADCQKKKISPTPVNIFAQYLNRIRANIHLVICMSPLGDAFRNRLRKFPALVNCCTIDWFMPWPDDALRSVATRSLLDNDLGLQNDAENLVEMFKAVHQSVEKHTDEYRAQMRRHNYVTPTSFLSVLSTYKDSLKAKRAEINTKISRLGNGLNKLKTTKAQVKDMQENLVKLQPQLTKTSKEVEAMMIKITADKAVAAETKVSVEAEETEANEIATKAKNIADSAQRDLDEALPALDAALKSLDKLKKADIDEVKSLAKPPVGVKLTMEATCIMFEVTPDKVKDPNNQMGKKINDYWRPAQKLLLNDPKALLEKLKCFDKGNIPGPVIDKIGPYIEKEEFQPKAIEKASKACTAICMWVHAMNKYHWISISVEPKRKALCEAEAELADGMKRLESARAQLKAVLDNIQSLETQFSNAVSEKEELGQEIERCKVRLDSAMKLIGGLGGEETRWELTVGSLKNDLLNIIGDAVVCAGYISYLGAFPATFRKKMVAEWVDFMKYVGIPLSTDCSIIKILGNEVKIQGWQIAGLPSDDVSTENGIIMDKTARWPLLIDPQGQANRYVKNMGREVMGENFDVGKESDKNFMRILENGVRFGKWILLENIGETLDAALEPVLQRLVFKQGMSQMMRLGDNNIPYNESFRFFLTTKLPNPHYAPEICVKVTLLNFAITPAGLEEQLLGETILHELPDVASKKAALAVQNAAMNKELTEIEDRILFLLSSAEGNILDNVEVINALDEAKKTSVIIGQKMKEAVITEKQIDESRESYRPVAAQASVLFFCIVDLATVDPMYQYSLLWFTQLFVLGVRDSEPSSDLRNRMENLKTYFSYLLYENVCRSLFEKHKLLFAFLLCIRLLQSQNKIDPDEWRFLISGNTSDTANISAPDAWLGGRTWSEIQSLSSLPAFLGLAESFGSHNWKKIFDSPNPETEVYPDKWNSLNDLQKICILRALRPDKIVESMQSFVTRNMGRRFVEPPPFDLPLSFKPSTVFTPLIFVLSPGSDPMKDLFNFADAMKMRKKFKAISLGQGQGPRAEKLVQSAMQKGEWVLLQNCHLMASWMTKLEKVCDNIDPDKVHKDFRLWLSSMPNKNFPVSVLQNGIKMTNEPPRGLRASLRSTYYRLNDEKLNSCSKPHEYKKLLFALSFFHALVIERKKFGPLGWNGCLSYEFNETDFDICQSQLQLYLDKYDEVPYSVLKMLTEAINYGGRVTDDKDMRTIEVIMSKFYHPEVMNDDYCFSGSGIYKSFGYDPTGPYESYNEYISQLPLNPSPEVFGMHDNANITCAQNETFAMFDVLLSLQGRGSVSSGPSPEDQIAEIAKNIELQLPLQYNEEAIELTFPVTYEESMNTVLVQEVKRFNRLLQEMKASLNDVQRALAGLVLMSGDLESVGDSLFNNRVPAVWEMFAYPSLKPLSAWVEDLIKRLKFLQQWCDNGTPKAFWISGLFFPQAFVTGTKQNYARKRQAPIDTISFNFPIKDEFKTDAADVVCGPENGCYMYGLFLEAARWNFRTHVLDDPLPKELYSAMPVIHLEPVQHRALTKSGVYHCPVYKELTRRGTLSTTGHSTNFVMWIELPSDKKTIFRKSLVSETNAQVNFADSEDWVNGGVAMFCSLRF